jgi:large subunit ribosomal protein L6
MSKIGRKPIEIGNVQVSVEGNEVSFSGKKDSGKFVVPHEFQITFSDKKLSIKPTSNAATNADWGLNRALLANKIKGADTGFEKQLRIVGLGFKAVVTGNKVQLTLGFSHKIDYELPEGVSMEADKVGTFEGKPAQVLTLRSCNKEKLGKACAEIRAFKEPEPYKGVGIQYVIGETLIRKAGKTAKSS